MTDFFSLLKQLCGSAGVPAVIADRKLDIVWLNPLADTNRCPLNRKSAACFFENGAPSSGLVCFSVNDTIHKLNVMKAEDLEDKTPYTIIELIGSDELKDLLTVPEIRDYVTYLCAKIREFAGRIAISADEIDAEAALFGAGGGEVTNQLNEINKGLMMILREVINPEQLYYVLDPGCDDSTICVADEIAKAASDAKRSLGRTVRVSRETEKGIYTRMNRSVFETIISNMAEECCTAALYPEELVFYCSSGENGSVTVSVKSRCPSGRKNKASKFDRNRKGGKIYFEYLCDVMCRKYGASFTRQETPDGYMCSMEIKTINPDIPMVMNGSKFNFHSERFCTMTLTLAEHHLENRYRFIDIDGVEYDEDEDGSGDKDKDG